MANKIVVSGVIFGLGFLASLYPQPRGSGVSFKQISPQDGLSQRTVFSMVQDTVGFLWFGTQDGLNRYDGYGFKVYKNSPVDSSSLSDNRARVLFLDREGILWVGTANGLNQYDQISDSFTRFYHDPQDPGSLNDNDIRSIYQDHGGNLWIGTDQGGLQMMLPPTSRENAAESVRFRRFVHDPEDQHSLAKGSVLDLEEDLNGNLWVGTLGGGLSKFDRESETFVHFQHDPENPNSLPSDFIMTICRDFEGSLWLGTYGAGLVKFNPQTETFTQFKPQRDNDTSLQSDRIISLFQDPSGILWAGTLGEGVCRTSQPITSVSSNGESGHSPVSKSENDLQFICYRNDPADPRSLSDNIIRSIYSDRSGNLWLGTNLGGVNKLDLKPPKFEHVQSDPKTDNSLGEPHVNAILKDREGTLWVGTNNILNKYDDNLPGFRHYRIRPSRFARSQGYIFALCEDEQGRLWIGTYGEGLFEFVKETETFRQFEHDPGDPTSLSNNRVTALLADRFGFIWVGTENNLNRFAPQTGRFERFQSDERGDKSLSHYAIRCLLEDQSGNLWVGTQGGGLNLFDWQSETFRFYQNQPGNPNSLSSNLVYSLYEDGRGYLWVGTSNGLNRLEARTGEFRHYFESDGLPNAYIAGILGDKNGNLWVATNHGLTRFNPDAAPGDQFRNYDLTDGLQGLEFYDDACYAAADGEMFFGGSNGFNRFYPERVKDSDFVPPIVITSFKKLGKEVTPASLYALNHEVDLTYKENYISIEFAALDFSYPERNQYAYKLEGLDEDWIHSGSRRFVNYSNLNPGDYLFRVKGSNSDGQWNEQGASLAIVITPPFWQTWWFRILAGGVLVGVLALAYNYRVRKLLEIERTRNRIAQDLHDEVGATLSSISYFAQAIRAESETQNVPVSQKFLSLISESSSEAQEAMSDIIWTIDPTNDKWDKLLAKFRRYASDLFDSKNLRYDIRIPDTLSINTLDMEQRRNFWLIFKEMITNVAKHARCQEVSIQISTEARQLHLRVADDGVGFDPEIPNDRNGIKNIHTRAQKLNAQLDLKTSPGGGTQWHLTFNV